MILVWKLWIKNPWKSLNVRKITFIGLSIINRLCMKQEKIYRHMWTFWGVIITTISWKTLKTLILAWKLWIKNPWKSLNVRKITFIWLSIINRLCMKLEKIYKHMWTFRGVIITTICRKTFKNGDSSMKIVNKKSLKIPEYEKNNFYWVHHPK